MIYQNDIANLKTDIGQKIGQKIIVKGSLGRNRPFEKQATLEKVYPSIFIVKYDENQRNVTYSYTDILTRTVELQVFDGESYSSIIPPEPEGKKKRKVSAYGMLTKFALCGIMRKRKGRIAKEGTQNLGDTAPGACGGKATCREAGCFFVRGVGGLAIFLGNPAYGGTLRTVREERKRKKESIGKRREKHETHL